jgi:uncharacterized protein (DUF934 family)
MPNQPSSHDTDNKRPYLFRGEVAHDEWLLERDPEAAEAALTDNKAQRVIVPLAIWQENKGKHDDCVPWLAADTELSPELAEALVKAPLIAIDFPKFTDGRGYSIARLLRERYDYQGEVRAIGDVLVDQLFFMTRCGFDGLSLREDQWVEDALRNLHVFTRAYQPAIDHPEPLFRLRERERKREPKAPPEYANA